MQKLIPHLLFLFISLACNSKSNEPTQVAAPLIAQEKDCIPGEETFNYETTFVVDSSQTPSDKFYSIVNFITAKKLFKPTQHKSGQLKIEKENSKTYSIAYDSCNMKRLITKNFILKNIQVASIGFNSTKKEKHSGLTPGFRFEEWKFISNNDRDSAMKIVQMVYNNPSNVIMYEKRYSQFIIGDRSIFLLETGAKFAETYTAEYKKLIEQHIQSN